MQKTGVFIKFQKNVNLENKKCVISGKASVRDHWYWWGWSQENHGILRHGGKSNTSSDHSVDRFNSANNNWDLSNLGKSMNKILQWVLRSENHGNLLTN